MFTGAGYYNMATDQLERFRATIDGEATGAELDQLAHAVEKKGLTLGSMTELKTGPRGFPKDHPRIEFLRRKGLFAGKEFPLAKWMHGKGAAREADGGVARTAAPLPPMTGHISPSTLPPEDFDR